MLCLMCIQKWGSVRGRGKRDRETEIREVREGRGGGRRRGREKGRWRRKQREQRGSEGVKEGEKFSEDS